MAQVRRTRARVAMVCGWNLRHRCTA
jgi:hypothetical protein